MKRQLLITEDGSHTVSIPDANITYHSVHGAVQESRHVYVDAGIKSLPGKFEILKIFEIGFGTGLNALLSLEQALLNKQKIRYTAVELVPLEEHEYRALNYCSIVGDDTLGQHFLKMHTCGWDEAVGIHPQFTLHKIKSNLANIALNGTFHCILFDAFAPNDQPELWTTEIFEKMFAMLENRGILVTYCSKGAVRRAMTAAGFIVEKLPGPPGKKEIIRAAKMVD